MGVRRMLHNGQLRFVIAEFVEDIGRIPDGRRNHFGPVLRELIRTPAIERHARRIGEVAGERPRQTVLAGDGQALAIGGRKYSGAPCLAQGQLVVVVDQGGERRFEGVFAEMPGGTPGQAKTPSKRRSPPWSTTT